MTHVMTSECRGSTESLMNIETRNIRILYFHVAAAQPFLMWFQ